MAMLLESSLKHLDGTVTRLRGALDSEKGLSMSLALKEIQSLRGQQERMLTAMAEHDERLVRMDERISEQAGMSKELGERLDKAAKVIAPLVKPKE